MRPFFRSILAAIVLAAPCATHAAATVLSEALVDAPPASGGGEQGNAYTLTQLQKRSERPATPAAK